MNLRQAAQQALEALGSSLYPQPRQVAAIAALRAALAEPVTNQCAETCERAKLCAVCARGLAEPVQEPVHEHEKWCASVTQLLLCDPPRKAPCNCKPTAPPQRKPLTDEEIWRTYKNLWMFHPAEEPRLAGDVLKFARAIERAHGIGDSNG